MDLDRFSEEHMSLRFPIQDEPDEYSECAGCGESIFVGYECLNIYGMCIHDDFDCVKRATDATLLIAGDDDD